MDKKITVIIPIYNGEKYIERCVSSVLSQKDFDKNDIEILLINDGSSDGSLGILKKIQKAHPSIINVVNQQNIGVAKTRNKAINIARGRYIIFIDQDDWIDEDFCTVMYKAIEKDGLDVVCGGYRRPDVAGKVRRVDQPADTEYGKYIIMAAWSKIHRTSFVQKCAIEFFSNKFGEDSVFTIKEICHTTKWRQINYVGYNWYFNEQSVSNVAQKGFSKINTESLKLLLQKLIEASGHEIHNKNFNYFMLRTVVGYLLFSGRSIPKKEFVRAAQELFGELRRLRADIFSNNHLPLGPEGETIKARVAIAITVFLYRRQLLPLLAFFYCQTSNV